MKKILFILLLFYANCFAQNPDIQMQVAFPNLPAIDFPVSVCGAGDNTNRIFVTSLYGKIYVFPNDSNVAPSQKKIFLDILNLARYDGEMGLLGLAFDPNYATNGYFYVDYNNVDDRHTTISRFSRNAIDPNKADSLSEFKILEIYQPYGNHVGGQLLFGQDGYLYIGMGDGGSTGDPGNRAQNPDSLLGKVLRIDVHNTSGGLNYAIPPDNPFAGDGGRGEIYALGFRNAWKFCQDPVTGIMILGDVGQDNYEEIDILQKGKNYGWRITEGFHCYNPAFGCDTSGITMPIKEYSHSTGCAVISGCVYRGQRRPELAGAYIYGDYCTGKISMLRYNNGTVTQDSLLIDTPNLILGFGVDENKEMYCCAQNGFIYRFNKSTLTTNVSITAIPDGLYDNVNNRLNMKDSVKVYLRENAAPNNIVDSAMGVLDSLTFTASLIFNKALTGNYYIDVKHRNSLETWSKSGGVNYTVAVNTNYNFTTAVDQSYGNNMILKNGKWCMYSGDIDRDGFINGNDFTFYSSQYGNSGYLNSDLNGDGIVNGNDFTIFSNNYGKSLIRP